MLSPNRSLLAACVLLAIAGSTFALDNGVGLLPPLGWNTWCTLGKCGRDYCDAQEVMEIADTIVSSGLKDIGFEYVNLDDCWASHRDDQGNITADPDRFPKGLKAVIDYVHSKGLKFGLYTDAGEYTCSQGERPYKIPGSYGHYEQDAWTYASWGVDYVKMDWCNTNINGSQLKPEIQYQQMSNALNATGRPIYFLSCEWGVDDPWKWMGRFANAWRATGDHHDDWGSTGSVIEQVANLSQFGGPGRWNYMDFAMTGGQGCDSHKAGDRCPGQSDTEYVTEFTIWTMAASPIIVASDLRNMSDIQKRILFNTEMLAIHQDKMGRPGGRVATWSCAASGDKLPGDAPACQIWARPLMNGDTAVTLYNADNKQHDITLDFSVINLDGRTVSMRDVWAHKDLGHFQNNFTATVEPHGVVTVRVTVIA